MRTTLLENNKLVKAGLNHIGKKGFHLHLWIMLFFPLVWVVIFHYIPMLGIMIAFKNYRSSRGFFGSEWVGVFHFIKYWKSYYFSRTFLNTLGLSFYQLAVGFPIPIILALSMNSTLNLAFKKVVQFFTYMPFFISTVVMVGIILQFLHPYIGVVNLLRLRLGLDTVDFMSNPDYFKSIYVWSGVWQFSGWGTIIYLAALSNIDPQLHEAAIVDGAGRFKRILHIDIPGIMPTAVVLLIIQTGRVMNLGFEKVFLMQNPLNYASSEVISTYVYKVGLAADIPNFSYGTAIGLFLSLINLALIISVNHIARRVGETSLW